MSARALRAMTAAALAFAFAASTSPEAFASPRPAHAPTQEGAPREPARPRVQTQREIDTIKDGLDEEVKRNNALEEEMLETEAKVKLVLANHKLVHE